VNVALIGFMGAGKSYYAEKLAFERGLTLISTDMVIERELRMTIPEIFERLGEKYFRDIERATLIAILEGENQLIDCGGGLPIYSSDLLCDSDCRVIFIDTPFHIIWERICGKVERPLSRGKTREDMIELYTARRPVYLALADEIIKTD